MRNAKPFWDIPIQHALLRAVAKSIYTSEREALTSLLHQLRVEAGMTQSDLAKRLRRHQSFVSKYEQGQRRLDLVEVREVCVSLGTSLSKFVIRFEAEVRRRSRARPKVRTTAG